MAKNVSTSANLGFEEKLWKSADKFRSNLDASEYRAVVLGLIFLKYISDAFNEASNEYKHPHGSLPDIKDNYEYSKQITFLMPTIARWDYLEKNTKKAEIGKLIDKAMEAIEQDNPSLKGVLLKNYSREALEEERLGELITLIGTIRLKDEENKSKDILGRVFEYFLGQFAEAEGKKGGQFYTPPSVVRLLVEMTKPYKGRVFDPCCGSGGMFVQSEKFVESHGGKIDDILVFGQESNRATWGLCKMNLAIRGIIGNIKWGDSLANDLHKGLKADFILANPPFNAKDWKGDQLRQDPRWKYGIPPIRNANYAWVQHFIHHLASTGNAGFILTNGSLSSITSNEGNIRKNIVESNLIDCIVTLPDKLFYNTGIPACLWIINKGKNQNKCKDRRDDILFIDARSLGVLIDRVHRELTENDIQQISDTYIAWKTGEGEYKDTLGFCKSTNIDQIRDQNHILTPARYIGVPKAVDEDESLNEKMDHLTSELTEQFEQSEALTKVIRQNLGDLGFDL